jgi:hypothetical protein
MKHALVLAVATVALLAGCTSAPRSIATPPDHFTLKLTIETAATIDSTAEECKPDLFAWPFSGGAKVWAAVKGDPETRYGESTLDAGKLEDGSCIFRATLAIDDPRDDHTYVHVANDEYSESNPDYDSEIYAAFDAPRRDDNDSHCNINVYVSVPRQGTYDDASQNETYPEDCQN